MITLFPLGKNSKIKISYSLTFTHGFCFLDYFYLKFQVKCWDKAKYLDEKTGHTDVLFVE